MIYEYGAEVARRLANASDFAPTEATKAEIFDAFFDGFKDTLADLNTKSFHIIEASD